MSRRLTRSFAVAVLVAMLPLAGSNSVRAGARCYAEWSEAAPIVERENLRSARDVHDRAREELGGDVVRIVLCEREEDGFVYRLVLRRPDGRIGTSTVSAARGAGR